MTCPDPEPSPGGHAPRLTGDTVTGMGEASIRDLRNHGGEVIERARSGERITITRDGKPVAELRPVPRRRLSAAALIEQARALPPLDPDRLRADIDALVDQSL